MASTHEERLAELGIEIPASSPPKANYTNCVQVGALLLSRARGRATVA